MCVMATKSDVDLPTYPTSLNIHFILSFMPAQYGLIQTEINQTNVWSGYKLPTKLLGKGRRTKLY